jgi:hypothetical protein
VYINCWDMFRKAPKSVHQLLGHVQESPQECTSAVGTCSGKPPRVYTSCWDMFRKATKSVHQLLGLVQESPQECTSTVGTCSGRPPRVYINCWDMFRKAPKSVHQLLSHKPSPSSRMKTPENKDHYPIPGIGNLLVMLCRNNVPKSLSVPT